MRSAAEDRRSWRRFGILMALLAAGLLAGCAAQTLKDTSAPSIVKPRIVIMSVTSEPALGNYGRVSGEVVDEKHQPIIGAVVKITGPALPGGAGAATDINGKFMVVPVPPGEYQVIVEAWGFDTVKKKNLLVTAGSNTRLECTLAWAPQTCGPNIDFEPSFTDDYNSTTTGAVISEGSNGQVYVDPK